MAPKHRNTVGKWQWSEQYGGWYRDVFDRNGNVVDCEWQQPRNDEVEGLAASFDQASIDDSQLPSEQGPNYTYGPVGGTAEDQYYGPSSSSANAFGGHGVAPGMGKPAKAAGNAPSSKERDSVRLKDREKASKSSKASTSKSGRKGSKSQYAQGGVDPFYAVPYAQDEHQTGYADTYDPQSEQDPVYAPAISEEPQADGDYQYAAAGGAYPVQDLHDFQGDPTHGSNEPLAGQYGAGESSRKSGKKKKDENRKGKGKEPARDYGDEHHPPDLGYPVFVDENDTDLEQVLAANYYDPQRETILGEPAYGVADLNADDGAQTPRAGSPSVPHISGTEGYHEALDPRYVIEPSIKFQPGQVFKVLWSEPQGTGRSRGSSVYTEHTTTRNSYGQEFHIGFRRFIVVANDEGHCTCVPILTYQGKACTKNGLKPQKHGIVFQDGHRPHLLKNEPTLGFKPVRMYIDTAGEKLSKESRVNYSKLMTIEHNVKVLFIGSIKQEDFDQIVCYAVDKCWADKTRKSNRRRR